MWFHVCHATSKLVHIEMLLNQGVWEKVGVGSLYILYNLLYEVGQPMRTNLCEFSIIPQIRFVTGFPLAKIIIKPS